MIIDQFDVFLFDLDGVIYIGEEPLPGAVECLERLRNDKKIIRFLTNDPCTTREKTSVRLSNLGIEADSHEIITSGYATARYLDNENIRSALVLSDENLKWECLQVNIDISGQTDFEAVVVGWDSDVSFHDIRRAAKLIHKGAKFIATNVDVTFPTPEGPMPAVGAIVEAIKVSTGQKPYVVGKPFPYLFKKALEDVPPTAKAVMLGDSPDTDILGAHNLGIPAILVWDRNLRELSPDFKFQNPYAVIPNLKALLDKV